MADKPVETPAEAKVEETVKTAVEAAPETAKEAAASEAKPEPAETTEAPATQAVEAEAKPAETPAEKPAEEKPAEKPAEDKPAETKKTPIQSLYAAVQAHAHDEIWGVHIADPETHVPSQIVLQKYLNANDGDLAKATDQLVKTLDWRAAVRPLDLLKQAYNRAKFAGLGYVTTYTAAETYDPAEPESKEVFTWNIYGSTKSIDETFGDLKEFVKWRVALMELALQDLSIATATKPITADYDPYKIFQVHDYKSISFLRQSPQVKSASTETIKVFAQNYPELLKEKFFVNVPAIMGFVYAFMKLFVAAKTIKKFHPMSNGGALASEFGQSQIKDLGQRLPKEYGGAAPELKTLGKEPLLEAPAEEDKEAEPAKAAAEPAEAKADGEAK